jgi:peptidoglycan hydrolase CwlO-like protein
MHKPGWILSLSLLILFFVTSAKGDDLSYISDEELAEELNARQADLNRTTERIELIKAKLNAVKNEISLISAELAEIDADLASRAALLYRLSSRGKALKYLFSSNSPTAFLKRIQTLKKLITSQMDIKRETGLKLAKTEDKANRFATDLQSAQNLKQEITILLNNLKEEQKRRSNSSFTNRS